MAPTTPPLHHLGLMPTLPLQRHHTNIQDQLGPAMSIQARSKPYPTKTKDTYTCQRCGIQRTRHTRNKPTHCLDCKPYKKDG